MMNKIWNLLIDCKNFMFIVIRLALKVETIEDVKQLPQKMIVNWMFIRFKK